MEKPNKKLYKKPVLDIAVLGSADAVAVSGGIASGSKLKQITDGSKENINIDSLN